MVSCFLYGLKDILIQPLVTNGAVIAFDVRVLLGLARLDVFKPDVALLGPSHQRATDIFRTVLDTYRLRLTAPFNDLVRAAHNPFSRQREVGLDA